MSSGLALSGGANTLQLHGTGEPYKLTNPMQAYHPALQYRGSHSFIIVWKHSLIHRHAPHYSKCVCNVPADLVIKMLHILAQDNITSR